MPWELIYTEEYSSVIEARKREEFLKSGIVENFLTQYLRIKILQFQP
jgi:hypothetical protein